MAAPRLALTGLLLTVRIATARDPWAVEVVSYVQGADPFSGYTLSESALGRPTVETYEDFDSLEPTVTVAPVYPAWDAFEIVSIGEGGELVLRLGQPLTDDPAHPYGVDLLVFGNALLSGGGLYDQFGNDPRSYTLPAADKIGVTMKPGVVSVSADGSIWYDFPDDRTVGGMLPTLGRIWLGENWGNPTDPTIPPDPDLAPADLANMNLAELCRRYRGGSGGTGFDLAELPVPEGVGAPKEFFYVKISVPDDGDPNTARRTEIDAVTVVSPVSGFVRWQRERFAWTGNPALEQPGASPEGDAFDNWQEYARGGDPHAVETELFLPELSFGGGELRFSLPLTAREAPWKLEVAGDLTDSEDWGPPSPPPPAVETVSGDTLETSMELSDDKGNYRLRLEAAP